MAQGILMTVEFTTFLKEIVDTKASIQTFGLIQ